jgi:hypothetical protein
MPLANCRACGKSARSPSTFAPATVLRFGFRVQGLATVSALGFRLEGLGFRVSPLRGLGFRGSGLRFGVCTGSMPAERNLGFRF